MIRTITDKSEYMLCPTLETNIESYNHPITLFGKEYLFQNDYWMKHIHIKVTDNCNARCPFCIERGSNIRTDWDRIYDNVAELLKQMNASGDLCTVSITGGEPCFYKERTGELIDMIKHYDCFLTMNTNFTWSVPSTKSLDYIDISRHVVGYDGFCGFPAIDANRIVEYRRLHPDTKIRIQCVLHGEGLKSVKDFLEFVAYYKPLADDISIRRLITTEGNLPENDLFMDIKKWLFTSAEFIEQTLKDYYVYETWNVNGIPVTLSHSNMGLLKSMEQTEPDNLIREIIVHPDGMISGSWYRDRKIIAL